MVDDSLITAGQLGWTIVKGPLEAVVGILYGIIFGIILWYLPHRKDVSCFFLYLMSYLFACFVPNCLCTAVHDIQHLFKGKLYKMLGSVSANFTYLRHSFLVHVCKSCITLAQILFLQCPTIWRVKSCHFTGDA